MRDENPTVYSTEWGRVCPDCGKPEKKCICKKTGGNQILYGDGVVRIARESKGRKGKTVTLIRGLPLDGEAARTLLSELKRKCGSGGALKDGCIEIQGDHRELMQQELKQRGYRVKIAGG